MHHKMHVMDVTNFCLCVIILSLSLSLLVFVYVSLQSSVRLSVPNVYLPLFVQLHVGVCSLIHLCLSGVERGRGRIAPGDTTKSKSKKYIL